MRKEANTSSRWLWSVIGAVALAAACSNGAERAPGTPLTDVSRTSTETYASTKPYAVLEQHRDGVRLTATINVKDLGRAEAIAREAVNELKGDAREVELSVYDAESKPPAPAWGRVTWTSGGGFRVDRTSGS